MGISCCKHHVDTKLNVDVDTKLEMPGKEFEEEIEILGKEYLSEAWNAALLQLTPDEEEAIIRATETSKEDVQGECMSPTGGSSPLRTKARPWTARARGSRDLDAFKTEEAKFTLLQDIGKAVDVDYDVLGAEALLLKLKLLIGPGLAWIDVMGSPVFSRFIRKYELYRTVMKTHSEVPMDWARMFETPDKLSYILGSVDTTDRKLIRYRTCIHIPVSLPYAMAVPNEIELMSVWNPTAIGTPIVLGTRTAQYMVLNYQASILGGLKKFDVLNEVRRFIDMEAGHMAEYITSLPASHPEYNKPPDGFSRPSTCLQNVWLACGTSHTVLLQAGEVRLPFAVTEWLASRVVSIAGKYVLGGLVANSRRTIEPGNAWEASVKEDKLGLYSRLRQCSECEASMKRAPSEKDGLVRDAAPVFRDMLEISNNA